MKYKVGDKVRIRSKEWYESRKNKFGKIWTVCLSGEGTICFDQDNAKYCGKEVIIFSVEPDNYVLRGIPYEWTDEMIEGLVEEPVLSAPNITAGNFIAEKDVKWITEYILPDGYIFKDENGNIINATKIVLEKKKKEYPKTYEECCVYLGLKVCPKVKVSIGDTSTYREHIVETFIELLICRDAYWKIAGEEMGLGKPWEPDWREERYIIYRNQDDIIGGYREAGCAEHHIFEFPTPEMRNAFKENFDPDIESCKELL